MRQTIFFLTTLCLLCWSASFAQKVMLSVRVVELYGGIDDYRINLNYGGTCYKGNKGYSGGRGFYSYEHQLNQPIAFTIQGFQKLCDTGWNGNGSGSESAKDCEFQEKCYGAVGIRREKKDDRVEEKGNSVDLYLNKLLPGQHETVTIYTTNRWYSAKFEYYWLPYPLSIEKTGDTTNNLCAAQPLKLTGILATIDTLYQNVVWEQNLDNQTITKFAYYCVCSNPSLCGNSGESIAPEPDRYGIRDCGSGRIPIYKQSPSGPDTVWTVIPNQTGSILNIPVPDFDYWDEWDYVRKVKFRYHINDGNIRMEPTPTKEFEVYAPPPSAAKVQVNNILCRGSKNGSVEVGDITGYYGTYYLALRNLASTATIPIFDHPATGKKSVFANLDEGNYLLKVYNSVKDSKGKVFEICSLELPLTITQPAEKIAFKTPAYTVSDYNGYGVSCYNGTDGHLQIAGTGGTGNYSYSLDNVNFQAGSEFTSLKRGDYNLYLRDQNGCMPAQPATATLTAPPMLGMRALATSYSPTTQIKCFGDNSGEIDSAVRGGIMPYRTTINGSPPTQGKLTYDQLTAGSYTITLTDQNNCTLQSTTTLTAPAPIVYANITTQNPTCFGSTDGSIAIDIVGGTLFKGIGYSTQATDPNGNSTSKTGVNFQATKLPTGTYQFNTTDDLGCTLSQSITLVEPEVLSTQITAQDVACKGESTGYLFAVGKGGTPPYSYVLTAAATAKPVPSIPQGPGIFANNIAQGIYNIEATDSKGCKLPKTVVQKIAEPEIALSLVTETVSPSCYAYTDGQIKIKATGGWGTYSYAIDNKAFDKTATYTQLKAGNYTLAVQDKLNCKASVVTTLTQPPLLIAKIKSKKDVLCNGGNSGMATITTIGGTPPYTFQNTTNPFQTDSTFTQLKQGSYLLQAKDANGCSDTAQVRLAEPTALVLSAATITNAACNKPNGSATVQAVGGIPGYTYGWVFDSNIKNPSINNVYSGAYYATVTDQNNCKDTTLVYINDDDGPSVNQSTTKAATCANKPDGEAAVAVTKGHPPYTCLWPSNAGSATTTAVKNLLSGNYRVEATDSKGCKGSTVVTVTAPPPLIIKTDSITNPICAKDCNGRIEVTALGGIAPYRYGWAENNQKTKTIDNLCSGSYTVTITDNNQCELQDTITLIDPVIKLSLGDSAVICQGQVVSLDAGTEGVTYQWTSNNGFSSTDRKVKLKDAGKYILEVINKNGCAIADTFKVITSTKLLKALFLMTGKANVLDTVNLIEYSWPMPESINWTFDKELEWVKQDQDWQYLKLTQPGRYKVKLMAKLGECVDYVEKEIIVLPADSLPNAQPRLGFSGIEQVSLFPNPNSGQFAIDVTLTEAMNVEVAVSNIYQDSPLYTISKSGAAKYHVNLNLLQLAQGAYYVQVKTANGFKTVKFLVQ